MFASDPLEDPLRSSAQFEFGKGGGFEMIPFRINQWSIIL